ncbi:MAG: hypothetical protein BGP12_02480 [Rhodospirillales bacterium 70-18]|nr:DUF4169 family protein [Rhodospirillales bacterium]OJY77413.1 MAG: hypothetical protein BGP12_02480 [Rhodospirillales bacterium 70-18]
MGEIVNLRRVKKQRAREAAAAVAAANRARHGRTTAEARRDALEAARRESAAEGTRLERDEPD